MVLKKSNFGLANVNHDPFGQVSCLDIIIPLVLRLVTSRNTQNIINLIDYKGLVNEAEEREINFKKNVVKVYLQ